MKKAAGLEKASGVPNKQKVAKLGRDKVREIAESKMTDLNAASVEAAMRMVEGTARSMGIVIEDDSLNYVVRRFIFVDNASNWLFFNVFNETK